MLKFFRSGIANLIDPQRAARPAQTALSARETEDTITQGSKSWTDFSRRENYKRMTILDEAFIAWRTNPIVRRIIELQTEFVVGDGLGLSPDKESDEKFAQFLNDFWKNEINDLDAQIPEWCDEAWRTGDLFLIGSVDAGGMTYFRALPSEMIVDIKTKTNDYRQETSYKTGELDDHPFKAYSKDATYGPAVDGALDTENTFVLHFPLNRAIGYCFGESDVTTVLYWVKLYRQFIEDRARLNFFRQLFTFVLQKAFSGQQTEKDQYVADFQARMPKKSGGILALDPTETIGTINPNLGSFEAGEDGMLIVRMIAIGVGMPLHWFGFAESNTRTTAEAAGTPSFRRLKARQKFIVKALTRMVQVAVEVRRKADTKLPEQGGFTITAPDITERDNEKLALAVLRITQAFAPLYNAKKITAKKFIELIFRFIAETPPDEPPDDTLPVIMSGSGKTGAEPSEKEPNE